MRAPGKLLLVALLSLAVTRAGQPGQAGFVVIVNGASALESISAEELRAVYLETNSRVERERLWPVLQSRGSIHLAFAREILRKSESALRLYYRELVFTGRGTVPAEFDGTEKVIAFVAKTPGAIAYIDSTARPGMQVEGVKAIRIRMERKGL